MTSQRTGCYGKLPIFGDFLRLNAGSAMMRALDQWFQEGIRCCEHTWGKTWPDQFAATAPLRFLFVSPGAGALVGVLVPGVDKAGRHYPFVVFREISATLSGESLRHLPVGYDQFLDAAEELASAGWRGLDPSGLYAAVTVLGAGAIASAWNVEDHLQDTTIGEALPHAFQSEDENGIWVLLQNLTDLARPGARPQYVLAQPGGGSARDCAVWLSIYRELNGGQPLPSVVMWGRTGADAAAQPVIRVLFDQVKPAYFQPMLRPDLQSRKLCHMAREGLRSADRIAHARDRFSGLFANESRSLGSFIGEFVALARDR